MTWPARMGGVVRGIRAAKAAAERERWPAERMAAHQQAAVADLVRHAVEHSPFHRERLGGGDDPGDLGRLPVLDKATLTANFDAALCAPPGTAHRVLTSSGSTGTPSRYVYGPDDWTGILAMFFRYNAMAGVAPRIPRLRIAAIGAPSDAAMTRQVAAAIDVGVHRILKFSVTDPLPGLVDALNDFRPQVVNVYPSIGTLLADEQLQGRLRMQPEVLSTSSELRTPEMTARITEAWGVRPFDLYGTTEGLWGVDCEHHAGIHLFEDFCVVENVDADGHPVPDGATGARLLVTNLFNRTLPLIRFAISDAAVLDRGPCACGRTLVRLRRIEGRQEDVLQLPARDGRTVAVHPTVFSVVHGDAAVREAQVVQQGRRVLVRAVLRDEAAIPRLTAGVRDRLAAAGVAEPLVEVEPVAALERTAAGKLRLVVADPSGLALSSGQA